MKPNHFAVTGSELWLTRLQTELTKRGIVYNSYKAINNGFTIINYQKVDDGTFINFHNDINISRKQATNKLSWRIRLLPIYTLPHNWKRIIHLATNPHPNKK